MEDLIAWLRACLDDDEKAAKFAFADHNQAGPDWHEVRSGAVSLGDREDELVTFDAGVSRHIARHDPAAVLADVAAKRAVLDATVGEVDRYGTMPPEAHIMADEVVKALASAYRHRPGWRTEWE